MQSSIDLWFVVYCVGSRVLGGAEGWQGCPKLLSSLILEFLVYNRGPHGVLDRLSPSQEVVAQVQLCSRTEASDNVS